MLRPLHQRRMIQDMKKRQEREEAEKQEKVRVKCVRYGIPFFEVPGNQPCLPVYLHLSLAYMEGKKQEKFKAKSFFCVCVSVYFCGGYEFARWSYKKHIRPGGQELTTYVCAVETEKAKLGRGSESRLQILSH